MADENTRPRLRVSSGATITLRLVDDGTEWDAHLAEFACTNAANFASEHEDLPAGEVITYESGADWHAAFRWTASGNIIGTLRNKRARRVRVAEAEVTG